MSLAVVLLLCTTISLSCSLFVCPQNYCKEVECQEVTNCTGPNQVVKQGGFCSCCDVCHTILGENEACVEQVFIGGPPPITECDDNLICYKQKCQKVENVVKKTTKRFT